MLDTDKEASAARGRELIAETEEREAAHRARAEAFAKTIANPHKAFNVTRPAAARMLSEALGYVVTVDAVRRSDCPYVRRGRVALYREADLREHAERKLAQSMICGGRATRGVFDRWREPPNGRRRAS
jgi:hypothetical protein